MKQRPNNPDDSQSLVEKTTDFFGAWDENIQDKIVVIGSVPVIVASLIVIPVLVATKQFEHIPGAVGAVSAAALSAFMALDDLKKKRRTKK